MGQTTTGVLTGRILTIRRMNFREREGNKGMYEFSDGDFSLTIVRMHESIGGWRCHGYTKSAQYSSDIYKKVDKAILKTMKELSLEVNRKLSKLEYEKATLEYYNSIFVE